MNFYTYIYRDPSRNNEPIYVGKGKGRRAYSHLTRKDKHPFIQRLQLMKSKGVEPYIEIIDAINENHAFFMEECLIEVLGRKDLNKGPLLNLTNGGEGNSGQICSAETRLRQQIAHTNKTHSLETKLKMSIAKKGKPKSFETKLKMSIAQQNMSVETKAKISLSRINNPKCKNKLHTKESKAKMSASHKARHKKPLSLLDLLQLHPTLADVQLDIPVNFATRRTWLRSLGPLAEFFAELQAQPEQ